MEVVLCADIGGTNTRLCLYQVDTSGNFAELELAKCAKLPGKHVFEKKYLNDSYASLREVISVFLSESNSGLSPTTACLAVAGPVSRNRATLTNRIHWDIDGETLARDLGLKRVRVVNDFVAMGYGLLTLDEEKECVVLQRAEKNPHAPIACIGAGTGLGQCFLTPNGSGSYECYASEGGHAEFAPRNDLEIRLLQYLSRKFATTHRISIERLVSGNGLANIYEFLSTQESPADVNEAVHKEIMNAPESDRGRVVAVSADKCTLCAHTMRIFTAAYGAEAGVAALKWLPTGGLYLTGGLTPKNIDYIRGTKHGTENLFLVSMLDKGRVSAMLYNVPVYAVMVEDLGERGALYTALHLLQEELKAAKPATAHAPVPTPAPVTTAASCGAAPCCAAKTACCCGSGCGCAGGCGAGCACGCAVKTSCGCGPGCGCAGSCGCGAKSASGCGCAGSCKCGAKSASACKCSEKQCCAHPYLWGALLVAAVAAGGWIIANKKHA